MTKIVKGLCLHTLIIPQSKTKYIPVTTQYNLEIIPFQTPAEKYPQTQKYTGVTCGAKDLKIIKQFFDLTPSTKVLETFAVYKKTAENIEERDIFKFDVTMPCSKHIAVTANANNKTLPSNYNQCLLTQEIQEETVIHTKCINHIAVTAEENIKICTPSPKETTFLTVTSNESSCLPATLETNLLIVTAGENFLEDVPNNM